MRDERPLKTESYLCSARALCSLRSPDLKQASGPPSSGSLEPERVKIRRSCPTRVMSARLIYRSAGACPPRVHACPQGLARDRPSPYVKGRRFFHRSAGACPPRVHACPRAWRGKPARLRVWHARARALRTGLGSGPGHRFYDVARGPVPRECSPYHSRKNKLSRHLSL